MTLLFPRPSVQLLVLAAVQMTRQLRRAFRPSIEELFENFPRGLALLELRDPDHELTWQLTEINSLASSLLVPSIETFLSAERMGLRVRIDLPELYRDVIAKQRSRVIGIVEHRDAGPNPTRQYMALAFPVGACRVGILFEGAQALTSARIARTLAERQLVQTCEFLGAILWRAEPGTLRFTYVSQDAQTILGYWPERWTGETNFWKKHLFPDDRERVVAACEKIVRERRRRDFEFRMITVHGKILWFHAAAEIAEQRGQTELVGVMNEITDLKRAEERIRALSSRMMRLQDDERRHISRELHDSLGQYLTSIKINVELVKRESTSIKEQHRVLLTESAQTLERCVQEVRTVSYLLHPPLLDELGLVSALRWFTGGFAERTGIVVNLDAPHEFSRLPEEMELALFRIVQESPTNVQRHSQSHSVWIVLSEHPDRVQVSIRDGGVGVSSDITERIKEGKTIEGTGIRGMYERVRELGGQIEIKSSPMGTDVSAIFPLRRAEGKQYGEERKSRVAGKRLEMVDLRIDNAAVGSTGIGEKRRGGRELRPGGAKRRRASRS